MSKTYSVTVYFEGTIDYEIEADSEADAKAKAEEMFNEEDAREVQVGVLSQEITDCFVKEE